jgi:hypothetical protein
MALDDLKSLWQQQPSTPALTREEIMEMVRTRARDTRRRIRRRMRSDILTYSFLIILPAAQFVTRGFTVPTLASFGYGIVIYAILVGTLLYKGRQIRMVPITGSMEQSLNQLIERVTSMMRAYMTAYMTVMVISVTIVEWLLLILLIRGSGMILLSLGIALAIVVLSYFLGRMHIRRILGKHRARLVECVSELHGGLTS